MDRGIDYALMNGWDFVAESSQEKGLVEVTFTKEDKKGSFINKRLVRNDNLICALLIAGSKIKGLKPFEGKRLSISNGVERSHDFLSTMATKPGFTFQGTRLNGNRELGQKPGFYLTVANGSIEDEVVGYSPSSFFDAYQDANSKINMQRFHLTEVEQKSPSYQCRCGKEHVNLTK